jgi:hypothetical protein
MPTDNVITPSTNIVIATWRITEGVGFELEDGI